MQLSRPAPDVVAFGDTAPIPGLGFLPVNAYLLRAEQPMLIDTGLPPPSGTSWTTCGPRSILPTPVDLPDPP